MDERTEELLAKQLLAHKVCYQTALNILRRVDGNTTNPQKMLDWLEQNPDATTEECCQMSRKFRTVKNQNDLIDGFDI